MNFHPIKYKQPTDGGDARCALYALCNLFNDMAFLLTSNVGESTSHNREVEILGLCSQIFPLSLSKIPIKTIYPHAITPTDLPIPYSEEYNICHQTGKYVPVLLDVASNQTGVYHTVLALWGDIDCIVIDSKKDFPETIGHELLFSKVKVHGFRILTGGEPDANGDIPLVHLAPEDLPHIFNITAP